MPGLHKGLLRPHSTSSTTTTQTNGVIAVANGSSLRSATVKKTDFKTGMPVNGMKIVVAGGTGTITGVSTSGTNYVITYSGGNAFSGGLGNPYIVYRS